MISPETKPSIHPVPPEELRAQGRSVPEYTETLSLPDGTEKVVPKSYVIGSHERDKPSAHMTSKKILNPATGKIEEKLVPLKPLKPRGPRFTSALYDPNTRRDFDYITPTTASAIDPSHMPIELGSGIFHGNNLLESLDDKGEVKVEAAGDADRSFVIEPLEDSPWLQAERSEIEQAEFDQVQSRLFELGRTQRVLEYVGRKISQGDGYMHRMSDEEYDEYGEELRPSTKYELKIAKKLEKIENERREELHHAFMLADPNYAEIKWRDSMTPAREPATTKKERKHHDKNRAAYEHATHRVKELEKEFRELMTSPTQEAEEIIEKYESRLEKRERSSRLASRVGGIAIQKFNAVKHTSLDTYSNVLHRATELYVSQDAAQKIGLEKTRQRFGSEALYGSVAVELAVQKAIKRFRYRREQNQDDEA